MYRSPPRVPQHNLNGYSSTTNKEYLGPPMNSLNRSRSRSPSHLHYTDSRRSISPSLPRKNLAPPRNRSRSPTPNFISTHVTKLANTRTQGPQSLPYIPTQNLSPTNSSSPKHGKNQQVSSVQIPMDSKLTMKSEATLQVSESLTDHSDNTSEVSDEGYRSLGIIQTEKGKNRASLYSQNSVEDVEENGK